MGTKETENASTDYFWDCDAAQDMANYLLSISFIATNHAAEEFSLLFLPSLFSCTQ